MNFKVGDFIRELDPLPFANDVYQLTYEDFYGVGRKSAKYFEKIEPWQPKPNEWCWFKDEKNTIGSLTKLVGIEEDGTYYGYSSCGIPDKAPCVEPFIGELPTFLQH